MDQVHAEPTMEKHDVPDVNLPAVMASLEMLSVDTNSSTLEKRRILRKRMPKAVATENLNRRCSLRPKKRKCSEMQSEDDIKEYYLDKHLKRRPNNLETIYEENDNTNDNSVYMSTKRYKRMIQFEQVTSDSKIKKRKARIKKVFGSKINFRRKRASMQMLLDKLKGIRAESPAIIDSEVK